MSTNDSDLRSQYDVVIVGAGVVGLGVGWKLARQGYEVLVLDKGKAGAGASRAAGGMLAPTAEVQFHEDAMLRLQKESMERYPGFVEELERCSGVSVHYRTEGTLVVALDRDDTEAVDRVYDYQRALGLAVRRLSSEEVHELEPHLNVMHSGVFCPDDHQLDNWKMVDALSVALLKAGGELQEEVAVRAVRSDGERVTGVELSDGEVIEAETVLIAAGAWSRSIEGVPELRKAVLRPVRGQMICIDGGTPPLCRHVIRAPDAYMVPKDDGGLVIGSTMEERGFDGRLTAGGVMDLLRGAWEAMPGIYDQAIRDTWTGFRPVSLDNHPMMGPSTIEGLWIGTGHSRHGILLAAATAEGMAAMIHRGQVPEHWKVFDPRRFH